MTAKEIHAIALHQLRQYWDAERRERQRNDSQSANYYRGVADALSELDTMLTSRRPKYVRQRRAILSKAATPSA